MAFSRHNMGWKAAVLALLVVVGLVIVARYSRRGPAENQATEARKPLPRRSSPGSTSAATDATRDSLQQAVLSLNSAPGPDASREALAKLRETLAASPVAAASSAIRELLDSGADAPTRAKFTVGPDGYLAEAPSLRAFLLDYLARIDPAAAAVYAEKILAGMDSPDEWAVALRNYAVVNQTPEGRRFLEEKLQAMLSHEPWQQQASIGFLESFDVAVHLGGTDLMPTLGTLVRQTNNQAVAHAAFLALDRLTIADPVTTLGKLQSEPGLMQGREVTRANYFTRGDVSDATQRRLLEQYLLNPQIGGPELKTFASLFPNANFMISHNLLTRPHTLEHTELARRDREALQVVEAWIADARFEKLKPQLQTMKSRLETFVKQARPPTNSP